MKKPAMIWPLTVVSILILTLGFFQQRNQWYVTITGVGIIIGLGLLDWYTPKIARLSETNPKIKTMRRLNRFFIVFFTTLFTFILWYPKAQRLIDDNDSGITLLIVLAIMGILGNTAPKLPFNRYMGLRLPWTIRDAETWKAAHRWLGYITFPIVIIMVIVFIVGVDVNEVVTYGILTWIAIPGAYSGWVYYKRMV
ncbi:SdpI family protein [Alkalibacterium kapii]|uniref:Immunity protein SdpI n=1 Tax=Alkalibacterium kapii TaxID=426704 RepID=A0A511AVB0_9LACT|nr:SdpI family protein [Alkalibacterium kapii]GEK92139.1 hypothetical protein AKA01nite_17610 [Alkalibacterium kapii]